ncbi:MAG TPA: protein kinase [Candidatus Nocardiopsis merdipullorum]|nr:protein kinase [Candidatus Nocardiopsis merdipullorum]
MSAHEPTSRSGPAELGGTVLSNRYRLEEQVGSGGMGTVWKSTDTLLNRFVAVKLLHPAQMAEPTARERFRTEGRITAGLSHPGIAQVYDYGEGDGRAFLIMELVVGEPLSQILREQGPLSADQTLDFVCQAAKALAAAHARGVVHRDIKPGNLLVTGEGQLKLTDFGIARGDMSVTLTQTGMVMGTAQYISPEQASGRPATSASDLYALGVVAYECLSGQPPFTGDSPVALALAHTREEPPELPAHVPADVNELVSSLLLKDPADRPSSASEVAHTAAVIRSNAGTGPPTPATGFTGTPPTTVVSPVTETEDHGTHQTADQTIVSPGQGGDSPTLTEESDSRWPVRIPVVLAAVIATVLIVGAVVGGFFFGGDSETDTARDSVDTPATVESPPPSPTVESEEDAPVETPMEPEQPQEDWWPEPDQTYTPETPTPDEGEEEPTDPPGEGDDENEPDPGDEGPGDTPPPEEPPGDGDDDPPNDGGD